MLHEAHVIHYALVGNIGTPCACDLVIDCNMYITNQWKKVTCQGCLEQKGNNAKNRPFRQAYRDYLKRVRKG